MKKYAFFLFSLITTPAFSDQTPSDPIWTGSILSYDPISTPDGVVFVEPYLFATDIYGGYSANTHLEITKPIFSISPYLYLAVGLPHRMTISFSVVGFYNQKGNLSYTGFGDSLIQWGYQFWEEKKEGLDAMISLSELFPTGRYQRLNPTRNAIDGVGAGSFQTTPAIFAQKSFLLPGDRWLRCRVNLGYRFPLPVDIEGLSVYGGGVDTSGTVHPGGALLALFAVEYQIVGAWVFASDIFYEYNDRSTFRGKSKEFVGLPSSEQLSITPSIEYNFSKKFGVIAGVWATVYGRNAAAFIAPTVALEFVF